MSNALGVRRRWRCSMARPTMLKYTQRKCTTNHVTGMTSCTTIVWYSNSK